jgi:pyridoxal phosphate enzyme (YggS family)
MGDMTGPASSPVPPSASVPPPDTDHAQSSSAPARSSTSAPARPAPDPALAQRIDQVLARIDAAAERADRDPQEILVLLATKTRTAQQIADAVTLLRDRGRRVAVGENRAQEIAKHHEPPLEGIDVPRHFIGRLQRNKARDVVEFAEVIHSVDRPEIAEALEHRAGLAGLTRDVLIQVNTSGEESKGGFAPHLGALAPIVEQLGSAHHLRPTGLMTIGANTTDEDTVRASLRRLRELRDAIDLPDIRELSMGMSADLEIAVEEGATIVRVGSAVFGPRPIK